MLGLFFSLLLFMFLDKFVTFNMHIIQYLEHVIYIILYVEFFVLSWESAHLLNEKPVVCDDGSNVLVNHAGSAGIHNTHTSSCQHTDFHSVFGNIIAVQVSRHVWQQRLNFRHASVPRLTACAVVAVVPGQLMRRPFWWTAALFW